MRASLALGSIILLAAAAGAQQPPAIRPLGPVVASSPDSLGEIVTVRHLKHGVLVNDVRGRRLLLYDDHLSKAEVIADSTSATANAYAGRIAALLPYRGDSSLFVDASTMSMLVVGPDGRLTSRVMSVPRSQDAGFLSSIAGGAGFDNEWRLVYRGMPPIRMPQMQRSANGSMIMSPPEIPDTAPVLRVNLATRAVDTLAWVKLPRPKMDIQQSEGRMSVRAVMNPLPTIDEFAVLSDGSVAFVRGRDYHVDFLRPDGSTFSAPKVPHEWQRMTDEDKSAFIDSVKAARARLGNVPGVAVPGGAGQMIIGGAGPGGGGGERTVIIGGGGGERMPPQRGAAGGGAGGPGGGGAGAAGGGAQVDFVTPDELPDYKPPFFAGNVRADAEGNIWIRTIPTRAVPGGPVYDVINAKGELVERVQVPADRTIIGFGASGVLYLRVGATGRLEKASVR